MKTTVQRYRDTWKAERPDIPYGTCWCGCGGETKIASRTYSRKGHVVGEPLKWCIGHRAGRGEILDALTYQAAWKTERPNIPYGKCWCGCGNGTPIASQSLARLDYVKGEPKRWCVGHSTRKPRQISKEDCGHITECWIWRGAKTGNAEKDQLYGTIKVGRKTKKAHRVYYEEEHGPIPRGHEIHHRCEQTLCVNPTHLEALSRADHFTTYAEAFSRAGHEARWQCG